MNYLEVLGLVKEPFSNSPDPEFFFQSRKHVSCLQKLEIAVRMRRGLNIVMGEVGTGKTTLSRHLIRIFSEDESIETHLILDPAFNSPVEALAALSDLLGLPAAAGEISEWKLKDNIKKILFQKGVDEHKTVVLILDEGQKIPEFFVEILRELLNFEVNEFKLLQIVIFAQKEFQKVLDSHPNFADRANLIHFLGPLDFRETRAMIRFRLSQAKEGYKFPDLFSFFGFFAVYRKTGGYPRKIIHLCHRAIITMIIQNRTRAGWRMVKWCAGMAFPGRPRKWPHIVIPFAAAALVVIVFLRFGPEEAFRSIFSRLPANRSTTVHEEVHPAIENRLEVTGQVPKVTEQAKDQSAVSADNSQTPDPGTETSPEVPASPETPLEKSAVKTNDFPPVVYDAPPPVLGQVVVARGESLTRMIARACGVSNINYLKAVTAANPELRHIDKLVVNQVITFPLPSRMPGPGKRPVVLVAIRSTLQEGFDFLREYGGRSLALKLVPFWNRRQGLKFGIFLAGCCSSEHLAEAALRELPAQFASGSKVVGEWDSGTLFFGKF